MAMRLKIVQVGEPVLRKAARALSMEEIRHPEIERLIDMMRDTMRDAPGVGLAAPQIGLPIQLAVIEDRAEYSRDVAAERLAERERQPIDFHVLINPVIVKRSGDQAEFYEGCLSLAGFSALGETIERRHRRVPGRARLRTHHRGARLVRAHPAA